MNEITLLILICAPLLGFIIGATITTICIRLINK